MLFCSSLFLFVHRRKRETVSLSSLPLGIGDLHGVVLRNLESLQAIKSNARFHFVAKLDKRYSRPTLHHSHFLKPWKLLEEHGDHCLCWWQVASFRRRECCEEAPRTPILT